MNAASVDVKDIIIDNGSTGLVFGTDLFIGREPESPNNVVTIFDTPGGEPQLTFAKGEDYLYPRIQIRARNKSYTAGWDLLNDLKVLLHGLAQETWNGTLYSLIRCVQEPALLDWDENERARFVATFELQRR